MVHQKLSGHSKLDQGFMNRPCLCSGEQERIVDVCLASCSTDAPERNKAKGDADWNSSPGSESGPDSCTRL